MKDGATPFLWTKTHDPILNGSEGDSAYFCSTDARKPLRSFDFEVAPLVIARLSSRISLRLVEETTWLAVLERGSKANPRPWQCSSKSLLLCNNEYCPPHDACPFGKNFVFCQMGLAKLLGLFFEGGTAAWVNAISLQILFNFHESQTNHQTRPYNGIIGFMLVLVILNSHQGSRHCAKKLTTGSLQVSHWLPYDLADSLCQGPRPQPSWETCYILLVVV